MNGLFTTKAGVFRPNYNGQWVLDWDGTHQNQRVYYFGGAGDQPVVGDWTGSGTDSVGVFRNGVWYLTTSLHGGNADMAISFGDPGDIGEKPDAAGAAWRELSNCAGVRATCRRAG